MRRSYVQILSILFALALQFAFAGGSEYYQREAGIPTARPTEGY
jgi:hypothetical protein